MSNLSIRILDEIKQLRKEVKELSDKIDNIDNSCSKMDSHINFVEDTYDNLKNPINIVSNLITTNFTSKLPEIKNNKY